MAPVCWQRMTVLGACCFPNGGLRYVMSRFKTLHLTNSTRPRQACHCPSLRVEEHRAEWACLL